MNEHLYIYNTDVEFIEETLPHLRGWLFSEAAYMTCHLIRSQTSWGIKGGGVEIGVFEGRYLALLYRLLSEREDVTVGIDTFQYIPEQNVVGTLKAVLGDFSQKIVLKARDSTGVRPEEICNWLSGNPAIVSIDGDHSADAVKRDIVLAESVLCEGGLVIVDDFFNHFAVGVSEGVYSYLAEKQAGLVPCIFIGQKLFFCRPPDAERYRKAAFAFGQNLSIKTCEVFRSYLQRGRIYVEPSIAGSKVVMFVSPHCDATYEAP